MAYVTEADVVIDAPPSQVWPVLTRFEDYAHWNPLIVSAEGEAEPAARITVHVAGIGLRASARDLSMHGSVLMAMEPSQLRWLVRLWFPGLLDMEHGFIIEDLPGAGTRLVQRGRFEGVLALFLRRRLERAVPDAFQALNRAVKQRVEEEAPDAGL